MGKEKPTTSAEDTEVTKDDLQKSLDANLAALDANLKVTSDESIEELLKSEKSRKKIKEKLDEYEKGEDDEDEEDEEEDEEKEEEDEEEMKGKGKKKGMKKSLDDTTAVNEEIIDAVPVLKSFVEVLGAFASRLDEVSQTVSELRKSQEDGMEIQKSVGAVLKSTGELLKSMNEDLEAIGATPLPAKGIVKKSQVLEKSFGEEGEDLQKSYPLSIVRDTLLKSVQEGTISANAVAKWELARYDINAIPLRDREVLMHKLEGGK